MIFSKAPDEIEKELAKNLGLELKNGRATESVKAEKLARVKNLRGQRKVTVVVEKCYRDLFEKCAINKSKQYSS